MLMPEYISSHESTLNAPSIQPRVQIAPLLFGMGGLNQGRCIRSPSLSSLYLAPAPPRQSFYPSLGQQQSDHLSLNSSVSDGISTILPSMASAPTLFIETLRRDNNANNNKLNKAAPFDSTLPPLITQPVDPCRWSESEKRDRLQCNQEPNTPSLPALKPPAMRSCIRVMRLSSVSYVWSCRFMHKRGIRTHEASGLTQADKYDEYQLKDMLWEPPYQQCTIILRHIGSGNDIDNSQNDEEDIQIKIRK
ncbi:MAG: hypothetical protein EZS28_003168 [Streblomastix strix]|uniref:Uncharacterized protein n=1 Tax=Streblomastix strix TaxID=222440 RepID=A0A5J4X211_9EUKA|nr:MAG: hypothetical protein EZS28_003168 [Streblomastix strix]